MRENDLETFIYIFLSLKSLKINVFLKYNLKLSLIINFYLLEW